MSARIQASSVYFIKLGRSGGWEDECLRNNTLRLGFSDADHKSCLNGRWEQIQRFYLRQGKTKGKATETKNQLRVFYESGPKILWITFSANRLWWCFSGGRVKRLRDGSKLRRVLGRWRNHDTGGRPLDYETLSGKLLRVQRFQGTICRVDPALVLRRINAEVPPEVTKAKEIAMRLQKTVASLIKNLHWKDFELLVDLIFARAGWQRIGALGKTQKTIDIELVSPVLGEKAVVQVKSQSSKRELDRYWAEFSRMKDFSRLFYVVHSSNDAFRGVTRHRRLRLLLVDDVAELAIHSGLVDWVLKKCS
ncbi:MAG: hypothetical protein HY301_19020 [Verrucomicrobia bacterium]|nr:hypothetical protein [Verrucomicrobiota bacterium]